MDINKLWNEILDLPREDRMKLYKQLAIVLWHESEGMEVSDFKYKLKRESE